MHSVLVLVNGSVFINIIGWPRDMCQIDFKLHKRCSSTPMKFWSRHAAWEGQPSCISSVVAVGPNWYFSSAVLWWEVVPGLSGLSSHHLAPLAWLLHSSTSSFSPRDPSPASHVTHHTLRLWEIQRFVWRGGLKTMPVYYHNLSPPPSLGLLLASDWSVRPHSRLWLVTWWLWGVGADTLWHLDTGDPQLLC